VKRLARTCLIAALVTAVHAGDAFSEENGNYLDITAAVKKFKKIIRDSDKSYGLEACTVFTGRYDTGFGAGIQFNQTFHHPFVDRPFLRSSPGLRFWGASNDSTDISVVGIVECLTHRMPAKRVTFFAGLTVGYYYIYKETAFDSGDGEELVEKNTNALEIFITLGAEFELPKESSVFLQVDYGETGMLREVHARLGMNFRYWREKEKRSGVE